MTRADWQAFCSQVVAAKETRDKPVVSINGSHFLYTTQAAIAFMRGLKSKAAPGRYRPRCSQQGQRERHAGFKAPVQDGRALQGLESL